MTSSIPLKSALAQVERVIEEVSAALLGQDTEVLTSTSGALREAIAAFSSIPGLQQAAAREPALRERLLKISQTLARQREALTRRAVAVDRALTAVLPQREVQSTYSGHAQSRHFRYGGARIYAANAT